MAVISSAAPLDVITSPTELLSLNDASDIVVSTIEWSPLHDIVARRKAFAPLSAYLAAVAVTYVPLLLTALVSPSPLIARSSTLRLPFLDDWNVAFMFLVSFPSLMVLLITDDSALRDALHRVQQDGVVVIDGERAVALISKWQRRFRIINVVGYGTGLVAGAVIAYLNYVAYAPPSVGYWIAARGRLLLSGDVFLWCVFLFYGFIPLVVCRTIGISMLLRDIVSISTLRLLPFHPDRCGGLKPVGRLGLRTQYALSVFGINLLSLVAISLWALSVPRLLYALMIAAAIAYTIVGPVVFMGPLLPFRSGMLRTKAELMGEVAQRLRVELLRLRQQLRSGPITKDDEELIERLRKLCAVIDELPVWPFDASTLRRFVTAYVLPILGAISYPLGNAILNGVEHVLGRS